MLSLIVLLQLVFPVVGEAPDYVRFYADNGYEQTLAYPLNRAMTRRELEDDLLTVFGLNHVPRPRNPNPDEAAMFMLYLYRTMSDESDDSFDHTGTENTINPLYRNLGNPDAFRSSHNLFDHADADTIMSFVNQDRTLDSNMRPSLRHLTFDVSDLDASYDYLIGAELRLIHNLSDSAIQQRAADRNTRHYTLHIRLSKPVVDETGRSIVEWEEIDAVPLNLSTEDPWTVINSTKALAYWMQHPSDNYGISLDVQDDQGNHLSPYEYGFTRGFIVGFFRSAAGKPRRPEPQLKRQKRSNEPTSPAYEFGSPNDPYNARQFLEHGFMYYRRGCQRRSLYVSFKELGWAKWIIAPSGYAAYYCDGECTFPLNPNMNATNHAIVQALAHVMNHNVPQPSCAPSRLTGIRALYFDDYGNVVLKKFSKMVIGSCGCH